VEHRSGYITKVLLDAGVPATPAALRHVKQDLQPKGWSGQKSLWEDTLSSSFGKSVKSAGASLLRSFFGGPKGPKL
jgi:hypothetical protein